MKENDIDDMLLLSELGLNRQLKGSKENMWTQKSFEKGYAFEIISICKKLICCTKDYEIKSVFKNFGVINFIDDMIDILKMLTGANILYLEDKSVFKKEEYLTILIEELININCSKYSLEEEIFKINKNKSVNPTIFHNNKEKIYSYEIIQLLRGLYLSTKEEEILEIFNNSNFESFEDKADILGMIMGDISVHCIPISPEFDTPENDFDTNVCVFINGTWRLLDY